MTAVMDPRTTNTGLCYPGLFSGISKVKTVGWGWGRGVLTTRRLNQVADRLSNFHHGVFEVCRKNNELIKYN